MLLRLKFRREWPQYHSKTAPLKTWSIFVVLLPMILLSKLMQNVTAEINNVCEPLHLLCLAVCLYNHCGIMSEHQDWSIKFAVFLKKKACCFWCESIGNLCVALCWLLVTHGSGSISLLHWHLQNVLHALLLLLQDAAAFPEPESRIRQYVYLLRWWVFPVHVETSFLLKMCVRSRENKAPLNICNHGSKVKTQQGYHVFLPSTTHKSDLNAHILAKGFID